MSRVALLVGVFLVLFEPAVEVAIIAPLFVHGSVPLFYPVLILIITVFLSAGYAIPLLLLGGVWRESFLLSGWLGETVIATLFFWAALWALNRIMTSHNALTKVYINLVAYVIYFVVVFGQRLFFYWLGHQSLFLFSWSSAITGLLLFGALSGLISYFDRESRII